MPKQKQALLTFICGLVSGFIFSSTAHLSGDTSGGMLIIFLPIIPLAVCGLCLSAKQCMMSASIAVLTIGITFDPDYIPLFVIIGAFPAYHFTRKALLWRGEERNREWYPVLTIIAEITALTTVLFMTLALSSHSEHNELRSVIAQSLSGQLDNPNPDVARITRLIISDWSFLIFAGISWIWVLLLYFVFALSNMLLLQHQAALRPTFELTDNSLPIWLPILLLVSGITALLGQGNDRFCGETIFCILLLPYFLSGIASVHRRSLAWKNREIWLVLFYVILIFSFPKMWINLLLIGQGIKTHVETLWKEKKFRW